MSIRNEKRTFQSELVSSARDNNGRSSRLNDTIPKMITTGKRATNSWCKPKTRAAVYPEGAHSLELSNELSWLRCKVLPSIVSNCCLFRFQHGSSSTIAPLLYFLTQRANPNHNPWWILCCSFTTTGTVVALPHTSWRQPHNPELCPDQRLRRQCRHCHLSWRCLVEVFSRRRINISIEIGFPGGSVVLDQELLRHFLLLLFVWIGFPFEDGRGWYCWCFHSCSMVVMMSSDEAGVNLCAWGLQGNE